MSFADDVECVTGVQQDVSPFCWELSDEGILGLIDDNCHEIVIEGVGEKSNTGVDVIVGNSANSISAISVVFVVFDQAQSVFESRESEGENLAEGVVSE